jgi:carbonic anhydrase
MDARIDPPSAFGVLLGSAHIVRNAGASARDALRSIVISQQLMHTREIVVIKHTDCGLQRIGSMKNNPAVRRRVASQLGPVAAREVAGLNFDGYDDVVAAVREDVDFLRKCAAVPDDVPVSGWVYETETGRVRKVV